MSERVPLFFTERLIAYALELEDYLAFSEGKEPIWRDFSNPYRHLIEGPSPLRHRIPKVAKNPDFAKIGLVLGVEAESREIVGSAGFHDFPDSNGIIEIGFGIVEEKQNRGFGRELLFGMWRMICDRPDVKILRYTVSPENAPSLHIIRKLGFELKGEQVDPEDGVELIYEQSAANFLSDAR